MPKKCSCRGSAYCNLRLNFNYLLFRPGILLSPICTDSWMWHFVLCWCDPVQSLISFVVFQFYVSSCSHFLQIPTPVGCWLTNFGINRAIKSVPLAQSRSLEPFVEHDLYWPYSPHTCQPLWENIWPPRQKWQKIIRRHFSGCNEDKKGWWRNKFLLFKLSH